MREEETGAPTEADVRNEIEVRRLRGQEIMEQLTGSAKATTELLTNLAPVYAEWVTEFALAQVWARPGLDLKTRSLCTVFKNEAEETFSQQDEGQHLALPFPYPGLFPPIICENQAIGLRLEYCIIGLAITRVWGS